MLGSAECYHEGKFDRTGNDMLPVYLDQTVTASPGELRLELTREAGCNPARACGATPPKSRLPKWLRSACSKRCAPQARRQPIANHRSPGQLPRSSCSVSATAAWRP